MRITSRALLCCFALLALVGCGSDVAQVSGRVLYEDGEPITHSMRFIQLSPRSDSTAVVRKAASAEIQQDGSFELFTRKPGDGVYRGQYTVVITAPRSPFDPTSMIPAEYTHPSTSPFEVDIDGNRDDLLFEIERLQPNAGR